MLTPSCRRPGTRAGWAAVGLAISLACSQGGSDVARGVTGPPSGGLVFVREIDGQGDLARARIADGVVVAVSATPGREESWPYWSERARRAVFTARPLGPTSQENLIFWDPETGEEDVLTPTPARNEGWPTWSPTQPRLAYAFMEPKRSSGIALHDVATGRSEVLASVAFPGVLLRPAFSPDGRRLVAQRRASRSPETELWLLEPGQSPRRLTSEPGAIDTKARFTRDGGAVLFTRRLQGARAMDLMRLDLGTGAWRQLASLPTADDHSCWPSPTRDEIAFVSDREGRDDIFLADLAGGALRNLTRSPDFDEAAPLWSPDGEQLVILQRPPTEAGRRPPAEEHRLLVIDREGRALFETQGMMADWMPAWPEAHSPSRRHSM